MPHARSPCLFAVVVASWLLYLNFKHFAYKQCGLTLRSTGPATAGSVSPVCGAFGTFAHRAYAACRSVPVSSNVRPHKMQLLAMSSRFVIAAEDARGDNVTVPRPSACADRASVVKPHASTSAALTSFGVRGK